MTTSKRILRAAAKKNLRNPRQIAMAAGLKPSTLYPKFQTDKNWTIDEMMALGKALDVDPKWLAYGSQWTDEDKAAISQCLASVMTVLMENGHLPEPEIMPLVIDVALDLAAGVVEGHEVTDETVRRRWSLAASILERARSRKR